MISKEEFIRRDNHYWEKKMLHTRMTLFSDAIAQLLPSDNEVNPEEKVIEKYKSEIVYYKRLNKMHVEVCKDQRVIQYELFRSAQRNTEIKSEMENYLEEYNDDLYQARMEIEDLAKQIDELNKENMLLEFEAWNNQISEPIIDDKAIEMIRSAIHTVENRNFIYRKHNSWVDIIVTEIDVINGVVYFTAIVKSNTDPTCTYSRLYISFEAVDKILINEGQDFRLGRLKVVS